MKKALALVLVVVLALGMSTVAFAAGNKIDRTQWDYDKNLQWAGVGAIDEQTARNDTVFNILAGDNLSNITPNAAGSITKNDLNASEFDIRLKWSKGSQVFDDYEIVKSVDGESKIIISYTDVIKTVSNIDFKYSVIAVINGRSLTSGDNIPVVEGTYEPEEFDEWEDDWFEFDGQNFVKPNTFIRSIEFSFSDDISVFGRALKGVKYYGYASGDLTGDDEARMVEYSSISNVYHLDNINVAGVAEYVVLNNDDANAYVYDGELNYLGRGGDKLPYADTYYLSSAELEIESDIEEEPEEEDDEFDLDGNEELGGDDLYPSNPHDNPGTGK